MNPQILVNQVIQSAPALCCPYCHASLRPEGISLICENGHCFDASGKGYINFAPSHDQSKEKYGAELFESRTEIFDSGFYQPVLKKIQSLLQGNFSLADIGCGEGYYTRALAAAYPSSAFYGLDISRYAVSAAARKSSAPAWLVADLKHMPLKDGEMDVLLDVLTPSDYCEFSRVLKPDGRLVKVIPGKEYLLEIRKAASGWLRAGENYDDERVVDHLREHARVISDSPVHYTRQLTEAQSRAFLRMTPMTFSVPKEALAAIHLTEITIDLHILECSV